MYRTAFNHVVFLKSNLAHIYKRKLINVALEFKAYCKNFNLIKGVKLQCSYFRAKIFNK